MATKTLYSQYDEQPPSPKEVLLTMYDLPDEGVDQPGMPDIFHVQTSRNGATESRAVGGQIAGVGD